MSRTIVAVLLFSFLALPQARGAEALKKIRIASKAPGESLVPYMISQRLGFYREEGFDVDVIVTRGTVTTKSSSAAQWTMATAARFRRSSAARG